MLYARVPRLGEVKTRLVPRLGAHGALALHRSLLEDAIVWLRAAARTARARPVLAFSEAWEPSRRGADAPLARAAAGLARLPQVPGDLGTRLLRTFEVLLATGHREIVIVGSDSPTLPPLRAAQAFARLGEGADAAITPAEDGGYCLVGARRVLPEMFTAIPWGTGAVLEATVAAARRAGIRLAILEPWRDIDTEEDLRRLAAEIAGAPPARRPRRTAAFLRGLGAAPQAISIRPSRPDHRRER